MIVKVPWSCYHLHRPPDITLEWLPWTSTLWYFPGKSVWISPHRSASLRVTLTSDIPLSLRPFCNDVSIGVSLGDFGDCSQGAGEIAQ